MKKPFWPNDAPKHHYIADQVLPEKQISQQIARGELSSKLYLISHLDIRQSTIFVLEENESRKTSSGFLLRGVLELFFYANRLALLPIIEIRDFHAALGPSGSSPPLIFLAVSRLCGFEVRQEVSLEVLVLHNIFWSLASMLARFSSALHSNLHVTANFYLTFKR
ncbi:hypothetical protein EAG_14441 [Camponotus floridanus]|uniref:Uncharacterized protein n=1 Tax=Camponotus floridanus TaxID=104421 RepID=E2ANM0_CAMFO|nr:hypothetical protein EAG_14441 [Camponotus floridanus]